METKLLIHILIIARMQNSQSQGLTDIKIGVLLPTEKYSDKFGFNQSSTALVIAEESAKNDSLVNDYSFEYIHASDGAGLVGGAGGALRLKVGHAKVILGSPLEYACFSASLLTTGWNFPHVIWAPGPTELSNKNKYTTVVNVGCPYRRLGEAVVVFMVELNYYSLAIISREETSHLSGLPRCSGIVKGVQSALNEKENRTLLGLMTYNSGEFSTEMVSSFLKKVRRKTSVILLCGFPDEERAMLRKARQVRMTYGKHVFILPHLYKAHDTPWNNGVSSDHKTKEAYKAVFQVAPGFLEESENSLLREFKKRFVQKTNETMSMTAPLLHDALYLYFMYLNSSPTDLLNGTLLRTSAHKLNFEGVTGQVVLDESGERIPHFLAWSQDKGGTFQPNMRINLTADEKLERVSTRPAWLLNNGKLPIDPWILGSEPRWPSQLLIGLTTCIITILVIVGFDVAFLKFLRSRKLDLFLGKMTWMVNQSSIIICGATGSNESSTMSLDGQSTRPSSVRGGGDRLPSTRALTVGYCHGVQVVMEKLNIGFDTLRKAYLMELIELRSLTHDNVNQFIGASVESPIMWLLFAYFPKGSLQNVLINHDISLNWNFKHSLIDDLTQGLHFIHTKTSFKSHGRLKSTNCIVDSRWVLKITDHGLPELRQYRQQKSGDPNKALLWTAPELLREETRPLQGTQKGDIYSFALITHEVVFRKGVFSWLDVDNNDLDDYFFETVSKVLRPPGKIHKAHRPKEHANCDETISEQCFFEVKMLMKMCWQEIPEERPSTSNLKTILNQFTCETKNLVDDRVQRMEKYAENLERAVDDRTGSLRKAKEKTDELLYRMLPKEVAEDLKAGIKFAPESYDSVTVFNSDIVGFTVISSKSTPQQIVTLLTDLNLMFDDMSSYYNVYKVETIGDSYMVASGLPTRNGDRHSREVCNMSLDFIDGLKGFKMHHLPNHPLQVRIGVHTGPVVAGVVGMKLPRYCLFGNTAIIATRMESLGEGLRIHLSEAANEAITKHPGYVTEKRGELEVKGFGKMTTYWLNSGPTRSQRARTRYRHSSDSTRSRRSLDLR